MAISIQKRKSNQGRSAVSWDRRLGGMSVSGIPLSNYNDNEYVGIVGVGTPSQPLTIVFDTGSSDMWIPSSSCSTCRKHSSFNVGASSSFSDVVDFSGETVNFRISYGSGDVFGDVATETLKLGNLTLPGVRIGLVTREDDQIASFDMDGICGLAFSSLAMVTRPDILDSMALAYPNLTNSFSMYLGADPDDTVGPSSQIMFGGYDLSIVSPNAVFYYSPLVRYSSSFTYWTVSLTGFELTSSNVFESVESSTIQFSVCTYE